MFGNEILVSIEWGNMLLWLYLEVFALGALILWTTNVAAIVIARRFTAGKAVHLRHKKRVVDRLPMNNDLLALPEKPKLFITLVRLVMVLSVAVSGIGVDPGLVFRQWDSTTHLVVATDVNFTGRSFNRGDPDNIQDFAVTACEDLNIISLEKYKAFLSTDRFSCNSGRLAGTSETLAEVIWDRAATLDIMRNGSKEDVNIKLGDLSMMDEGLSNSTDLVLTMSDGIPKTIFVGRRRLPNAQYGQCDGEREYLVVSNGQFESISGPTVA